MGGLVHVKVCLCVCVPACFLCVHVLVCVGLMEVIIHILI